MLNIVLFGPPGAGKGTQSEKLISAYQLVHLSTGDILRSEIAAGTQSGMEAKKLMDAGFLVPDEVVIDMIRTKLDQNKDAKGFIFDGFPRTAAQAEALDRLLSEKKEEITLMLALEVSDEELTKRLLLRGKESGRPDDVNEEIINKRIQEYNKKTAPLKEYYSAQNKYESVNGIGSIDEIFESLCSAINFIYSESTTKSKPEQEETVVEKITSFVKNVFTKKEEKSSDKVTAKKTSTSKPAKAAPAKIETAASRKSPNTPVKRVEAQTIKKSPAKKVVKKVAAKKVVAKKVVKKVVKKAAKKATPKKVVKKIAPKKIAAKKVVKKVVKKVAPKKVVKKIVKKIVKKVAPKKVVKKVTAKKIASKKTAPKKVVKKAVKKAVKKVAVKKVAIKKVVKKVVKKVAAKKAAPKKAVKSKKVAAKKAGKRK